MTIFENNSCYSLKYYNHSPEIIANGNYMDRYLMHALHIPTFRLFQEGHPLRNASAIFALTTLFYFIGAELRLVHELSLFWPLNGVIAGVLPAMSGLINCIIMLSATLQCWVMMRSPPSGDGCRLSLISPTWFYRDCRPTGDPR